MPTKTYRHNSVKKRPKKSYFLIAVLLGLIFMASYFLINMSSTKSDNKNSVAVATNTANKSNKLTVTNSSGKNTEPVAKPAPNPCASNTETKLLLVSISQRTLWGCEGINVVYTSKVITGMNFLAADLTPPGTYHIYSKQTNQHLIGKDSTGSWDDFVYYWMPFLSNQYGIYGFHDATWRPAGAFGTVSPDSSDASHGCVETPQTTAAWIYNWAPIGTTVTINA